MYDLDTELAAVCRELGVSMVRARTVGVHPAFISMIRELILERSGGHQRRAMGTLRPGYDLCKPGCCLVNAVAGRF